MKDKLLMLTLKSYLAIIVFITIKAILAPDNPLVQQTAHRANNCIGNIMIEKIIIKMDNKFNFILIYLIK